MLKYYVDLYFLEGNMESTNINEKIEEIKSKKYDEEAIKEALKRTQRYERENTGFRGHSHRQEEQRYQRDFHRQKSFLRYRRRKNVPPSFPEGCRHQGRKKR